MAQNSNQKQCGVLCSNGAIETRSAKHRKSMNKALIVYEGISISLYPNYEGIKLES